MFQYTIDNINNIKELHKFLGCTTSEAESLAIRGYTVNNLKAYYGDLPGNWMWGILRED